LLSPLCIVTIAKVVDKDDQLEADDGRHDADALRKPVYFAPGRSPISRHAGRSFHIIAEDGPLAGGIDTVVHRYGSVRQKVGVVSPDPDGSLPLRRMAERYTYNSDGQLQLKEVGAVSGTSDTDWNAFVSLSQVETVLCQ
jgi:hypothetical protein